LVMPMFVMLMFISAFITTDTNMAWDPT